MDNVPRWRDKLSFFRGGQKVMSAEEGSYMMKRLRKYVIVCRLLGCLFIEGIWDHSLKKARFRTISVYTLCTAAWILLCSAITAILVGEMFLTSRITCSFTKSLLFIMNSVVLTRMILNFGSMVRGSSGFLEFLRYSQDYEKSAIFAPFENSEIPRRRRRIRTWKLAYVIASLVHFGLAIRVPVSTLVRGEAEWWWLSAMVANIFSLTVMLFYDAMLYIILSCCSDVLADYLRDELAKLCRKDSRMRPYQQTCHDVEKLRLRLSTIKSLKRSVNQIWHPALAVWSASLILMWCVTLYSITVGDFVHPSVWTAMAYSAQAAISFIDLVLLSQALTDEAQKLKEAAVRGAMAEVPESCREQVLYLHDTIDPKSMCLTCSGFFHLNKALLLPMAGSIITYTVILVQTSKELAERVDVGSSLVRTHA